MANIDYGISGKPVYKVDIPFDNLHIIVGLPNGMYTVKTFNDSQNRCRHL